MSRGPTTSGVAVTGLVKRYPRSTDLLALLKHPLRREEVVALEGVDLRLEPGRIYGLVGPNGAGKTTLLKILAGLVLPSSGAIQVDGEDVAGRPERVREKVGLVVCDERSFFWRLSARQNLRFFAALQGIVRRDREGRVSDCLEKVGLAGRADEPFRSLSTGMRQRLAIARGLLSDRPILLLDEATRSLDPEGAAAIRGLVRELFGSSEQRIVVYSSHILAEVQELCSDLLVLRAGRLVAAEPLRSDGKSMRKRYDLRSRSSLREEVFTAIRGVQVLEVSGNRARLEFEDARALDRTLEVLLGNGLGLIALEPLEPTVEELFQATSGAESDGKA